jgi:hypothetical protein
VFKRKDLRLFHNNDWQQTKLGNAKMPNAAVWLLWLSFIYRFSLLILDSAMLHLPIRQ